MERKRNVWLYEDKNWFKPYLLMLRLLLLAAAGCCWVPLYHCCCRCAVAAVKVTSNLLFVPYIENQRKIGRLEDCFCTYASHWIEYLDEDCVRCNIYFFFLLLTDISTNQKHNRKPFKEWGAPLEQFYAFPISICIGHIRYTYMRAHEHK